MNAPLPTRLFSSLGFRNKDLGIVTVALWREIIDHEILTRSAAISFYAMLAFVPLIAVIFAVLVQILQPGNVFNFEVASMQQETISTLERNLRELIPEEGYQVVLEQFKRMETAHPVTVLSIGSLISLWVSSSLFMAVMDALNHIYAVKEKRRYWRRRAVAMVMTVVQSMLLLTSLLTIVAWPQILSLLELGFAASIVVSVVHFMLACIITIISFALTFQIGPHCAQRTAWITPGSVLGSVVFLTVSYAFRLYVQNFGSYNKVYGSLGGVMVLMLWFWVSGIVLLSAAATNKVLEEVEQGLTPL